MLNPCSNSIRSSLYRAPLGCRMIRLSALRRIVAQPAWDARGIGMIQLSKEKICRNGHRQTHFVPKKKRNKNGDLVIKKMCPVCAEAHRIRKNNRTHRPTYVGHLPEEIRFWHKVQVNYVTGCWEWQAGRDKYGYGYFNKFKAARWAYEFCNGKIPKNLEPDHLCRNTCCVNPNHLEAVTHRVNVLRGISPAAFNAKKQYCAHGHPYSGDNLILEKRGNTSVRLCKTCLRIRYSKRNERDRAKRAKSSFAIS